ncbi:hypothetical protein KAU37_04530 [Candidatus Bipolaricaulota bacterium]|nr:hypothetical protein [Candidatus Bipolaricaulota bacterium]
MTTGENEKVIKLLRLVQRQAGVSRRKAQELIEAGEAELNGGTVRDPFILLEQEAIKTLPRGTARLKDEEMDRLYHFVRSLSSTLPPR